MSTFNQFKKILQYEQDFKTADTFNYENHPAWERKGIERLREILFLGNIGNQFYVGSEKNIYDKIKDLEDLICNQIEDVNIISNLIVSARNEGLFRTIPITALVLLRKRDPQAFKNIFTNVVLTGNDLRDFMDINCIIFEGFGRAVKTSIKKWLKEKVNSFYALKYRKQIADAICISRPKLNKFQNHLELLYAYGMKKELNQDDMNKIIETIHQIKYAELFKNSVINNNINDAIHYANEGKLPSNLIIGLLGNNNNPELWLSIAKNMGTMQFLKYLNKLARIFNDNIEILIDLTKEKLTINNIKKAKIFPYRLFIAWKNCENAYIKDILRNLINQYILVFESELWNKYTYLIAPDISASMTNSIKENNIKPCYIAGFFSGLLGKLGNENEILAWDDKIHKIDNNKYTSIFDIYEKIANANGYGTCMYLPIEYLNYHKKKVDIVIIITDSEHWVRQYNKSVKSEWKNYKTNTNPDAKLVVLEIAGYGTSQVDEQFAKKFDVYTVFGWSDTVIKWIELKVLQ